MPFRSLEVNIVSLCFHDGSSVYGLTSGSDKIVITLSCDLHKSKVEFIGTLLHELGHALLRHIPLQNDHNAMWQTVTGLLIGVINSYLKERARVNGQQMCASVRGSNSCLI